MPTDDTDSDGMSRLERLRAGASRTGDVARSLAGTVAEGARGAIGDRDDGLPETAADRRRPFQDRRTEAEIDRARQEAIEEAREEAREEFRDELREEFREEAKETELERLRRERREARLPESRLARGAVRVAEAGQQAAANDRPNPVVAPGTVGGPALGGIFGVGAGGGGGGGSRGGRNANIDTPTPGVTSALGLVGGPMGAGIGGGATGGGFAGGGNPLALLAGPPPGTDAPRSVEPDWFDNPAALDTPGEVVSNLQATGENPMDVGTAQQAAFGHSLVHGFADDADHGGRTPAQLEAEHDLTVDAMLGFGMSHDSPLDLEDIK